MKIFEYMASKRPIITTDLPSLREVLIEGETALFTPPGDPKALAMAIKQLFNPSESRLSEALAENAFVEVSKKYTWEKRAVRILGFLAS